MKNFHSLILFLCLSFTIHSQTIVNLNAEKDNSMYSESGDLSNGMGDFLFAGRTQQGNNRRGLIKFDLSSIPAGSTINGVTLEMTGSAGGPNNVNLHRLVADWGEGNSDAPGAEGMGTQALPGDATWINTFYNTAIWLTSGGDFDATVSANAVVSFGANNWTGAQMISDVQDWIDGVNPNHGWIMIGEEGINGSAIKVNSRHNANPPVLTIGYTAPTTCMTNNTLSGPIVSGLYEVSNDLSILNATVSNGAAVIFQAGNSVTIDGDTDFFLGAEVDILIGPCM